MSVKYIKLYNGAVESGNTTGTEITNENPLFMETNTNGTEAVQNIAVRCLEGYECYGDLTLSFNDTENKKYWAFEVNGVKGEWGAPVTMSGVTAVNSLVKVYAKAGSDEEPTTDESVIINIDAVIQKTA